MKSKIIAIWICAIMIIGSFASMTLATQDKDAEIDNTMPVELSASNVPDGLSGDEWSDIQALYQEARYYLDWQESSNCYVGSNSRNNWDVIFSEFGATVTPRSGSEWSWSITPSGYGHKSNMRALDMKPGMAVEKNRIEHGFSDQFAAWYINDERGLEHGFTIDSPPQPVEGTPLVIEMNLNTTLTPKAINEGQDFAMFDASGEQILNYGKLLVTDSEGTVIQSSLQLSSDGKIISIFIEDIEAVYPLVIDPLLTVEIAKIIASDGSVSDYFGYSVSISGNTTVVGARDDDGHSGSAYVFEQNNGGPDIWGLVKKLTASDGESGDLFGWSVSIFSDTIVVGAPSDDVGANAEQGSAYVFERNTGGTDNWGMLKKLTASDGESGDSFGDSVSISGDVIVAGAYLDVLKKLKGNRGSAYVFGRDTGSANNWGLLKKLTASDGAPGDLFGYSVSISGGIIIIGAYGDDDGLNIDQGSAYVYMQSPSGPDKWSEVKKLTASDGTAFNLFGYSVSISGDIIVVGAFADNIGANNGQGSAYLFMRNTGGTDNWGEMKKLIADDGISGDFFGYSVSISGEIIVAGSYADEISYPGQGSAYVFERNTGGTDNWGEVKKLIAYDGESGDLFGVSVSISASTIVVGAYYDDINANVDQGSAYIYYLQYVENIPPVLNPIGNKTVAEGVLLSFTATATDPDPTDTLTFSLNGTVPAGASIDPDTGVFTWIPTEDQGPGIFTFDVVVTDDGAGTLSDNETISVTVGEVNLAPVLGAIGSQSIDEGVELTFTATATDGDMPANTLTFSLAGTVPAGATIDSNTGVFSWTPTEVQGPGIFTFDIVVTDDGVGTLTDNETISVTVGEANLAPVLGAIGNQNIDEDMELTFTATATDGDLPANTLTFSLAGTVPAGATIDPDTGVFTWIPTEAQGPGIYTFDVVVTDDGTGTLSDSETISVTVGEVNRAPVLNPIGNKAVAENVLLSFTVIATDPDLPANTLTFSLDAGFPTGAAITAGGAFTWTPTEAQGPGTYFVTIRVTDDGTPSMDDFETIQITVGEVNLAPVLNPIGNKAVAEDALLSFTATATDPDLPANTLTFSLDAGAPTGASITTGGAFTWTPTEAQGPGNYSVKIRVSDGTLEDFEIINIEVVDVNVAPVLDPIGNQNIDEGVELTFTATATDADLPANMLTFSLAGAVPAGATIDPNTGVFTWTPTEAQGSSVFTFDVVVTDDGAVALSDSETISVIVGEVNLAPVLDPIGNPSINEEIELTFTATATDGDLPANTLTFSLAGTVPAGATIDPNTGVFTWTPTEAQGPGIFTFDVVVTDDGTGTLSDSETISVTVGEVNLAPVLGAIGNQNIDEGVELTFTATATDGDLPANTLTFSLAGTVPAGASIDSNTGVFSWTPTEAQGPDIFTFVVVVTDDGTGTLGDSETISITVGEVNIAPVLGVIGNQNIDEGVELTFTGTATDADLPANSLTFNLAGTVPTGASIDPITGVFTWIPTEAQGPGIFTFDIVVTDDGIGTLSDSETISVTVGEINLAPVLGAIGSQYIDEGGELAFAATAADADLPANTLTFSLAGAVPAGAIIDPATALFTWTPTEAQGPGIYIFDVVVTDDGIGTLYDNETITITVGEVNSAPVLGAIGNQVITERVELTFTATATDSDLPASTLTYSLDAGAPPGAAITADGTFTWTPTEDQGPNVYLVTVRVTDDGTPNLDDFETIQITVEQASVHNIDTNEYFSTIQSAIDDPDTVNGHTIEVSAGTYCENVVVNKLLTIIGAGRDVCTIDGGGIGDVVHVSSDNVKIAGFAIINSGNNIGDAGIELNYVNDCVIESNNCSNNGRMGICLQDSFNNTLKDNIIDSNGFDGIWMSASDSNIIMDNTISNTFLDYGIFITSSMGNQIFHNNIISNANQAYDDGTNIWDDGYPSGGNCWSDYGGADNFNGPGQDIPGSDGIGDSPYTNINGGTGAQDNYPLTEPWGPLTFDIPLIAGWNLISLPLVQEDTSVLAVLSSIAGQWDVVKYFDNTTKSWLSYRIGSSINSLIGINHYMGFWLHATENATLTVLGDVPATTGITLKAGWNLVGYPSITDRLASDTLPIEADVISAFQSASPYVQDFTDLSLVTMSVGNGYWVHVTNDCVWTIDW